MPTQPKIDRPRKLTTSFPESIMARLDLFLFSEVEGRVPKGAYQSFFLDRIHEFFGHRRLDLAPFGFPQGFYVQGPRGMIDSLENHLKGLPV